MEINDILEVFVSFICSINRQVKNINTNTFFSIDDNTWHRYYKYTECISVA